MSSLQLGVIGCGNVLSAYRTPIEKLRAKGWLTVHSACGRASQRESALSILPSARFVEAADEIIESPEVDIVLILTSMREHARWVRAALDAGKHVLVEKPLATTLSEATELVTLSEQSRGFLLCAPFTPLSPTFQTIARRLRSGDIGKPCLARARYGWSGPWWNEWFYQPGGGCLFDLGVYCLTTLTGLLGPVERVTALTSIALPEREINGRKMTVTAEDSAQVILDFGLGTLGVLTCGFTMQKYRTPAVEIYGTTGTVQMLGDDWDPDGYELWQNADGCWHSYPETDPEWPWTAGLPYLVQCIRENRKPDLSPHHARHVLEVIVKAQQSSREGRALAIESTFAPLQLFSETPTEVAHLQHDRTREH